MKRYLGFTAALLIAFIAWVSSVVWVFTGQKLDTLSYHLEFETKDGGARCTGTAIAADQILTATHCETSYETGIAAKLVKVGKEPAKAYWIERDGNDHSIIHLDHPMFKRWAHIKYRNLEMGEHLRFWGYPRGFATKVARDCKVAGVTLVDIADNRIALGMDCYSGHGDSGAGLFDDSGDLVGVVSISWEGGMGAHPLSGYWTDCPIEPQTLITAPGPTIPGLPGF